MTVNQLIEALEKAKTDRYFSGDDVLILVGSGDIVPRVIENLVLPRVQLCQAVMNGSILGYAFIGASNQRVPITSMLVQVERP